MYVASKSELITVNTHANSRLFEVRVQEIVPLMHSVPLCYICTNKNCIFMINIGSVFLKEVISKLNYPKESLSH